MKKIFFLLIVSLLSFMSKAQNNTIEGALTAYGSSTSDNTTLTTGTADTVYLKGTIQSTGQLTLSAVLTGVTGNTFTGRITVFGSLDGARYYPASINALDSTQVTLSAVAMSGCPTSQTVDVTGVVFNYTKFFTFSTLGTTSATSAPSENSYKYIIIRVTSTAAISGTLTVSGRYFCRRSSAY